MRLRFIFLLLFLPAFVGAQAPHTIHVLESGTNNYIPYSVTYDYTFNVKDYGAVGDLQTVYDGSINSGSSTLTSASGPFVPGDVNKAIIISRAGAANAPLRTNIAAYISPTQVTITTNASSTVSSQMVDWGTDDTPEINAAIYAAWLFGSAKVLFPIGGYLLNGSLIAPYNSQLYIPEVTDATSPNTAKSIALIGESGTALPNFVASMQNVGVVIKSVRLGSAGSAILGSVGGGTWDLNYTDVTIKDITFEVYTNNGTAAPSMSGIDFRNIHNFNFENVHATIDVPVFNSTNPVSSEHAGIIAGQVNDTSPNILKKCNVSGFKYGFVIGEHTQLINIHAIGNYYGLVFPLQNYLITGHVNLNWNVHQIYIPNGQILDLEHVTTKRARINLIVETEFDSNGGWSDTQTFIQDVGNRAYGEVRFMWLHGGTNMPYEALGLINGGLNIQAIPNDGYTTLSAALAANTDNYTHSVIAGVNRIIFTPSASVDLTGINGVRMTEGRELIIRNGSATNTITIKNDVTSTAANRFLMNADFALLPNMSAKFTYDITAARWIKL